MNKPHLIAHYMDGFFHQYLGVIRGRSDKTILAYRDAIKLLLCFASDRLRREVDELTIEDLDEKVVLAFLDHIEKGRKCSVRTRNARFAAICTFFKFIGREEPVLLPQCHRIRTIPRKRGKDRMVDYLDEKEIQAVMNSINPTSRTGARDKALMLFLFNTGARVQEAVDVPIDHLRLDTQGHVKLFGKGRKERVCLLWPETVNAVSAYLARRSAQNPTERRLFLNANGESITRFGVRHIVQKCATLASQECASIRKKKVGPHTMRHSTAVHMLEAGNDINMVSQWLGHAGIGSTHPYAEISLEMKRRMLDRCSPPINKKARREWQKPRTIQWLDALSHRAELCAVK